MPFTCNQYRDKCQHKRLKCLKWEVLFYNELTDTQISQYSMRGPEGLVPCQWLWANYHIPNGNTLEIQVFHWAVNWYKKIIVSTGIHMVGSDNYKMSFLYHWKFQSIIWKIAKLKHNPESLTESIMIVKRLCDNDNCFLNGKQNTIREAVSINSRLNRTIT